MIHFLVHDKRDTVGVAVVDVMAGDTVRGISLDDHTPYEMKVHEHIPLGHKLALRDFKAGDTVTKYGQDIGKVVAEIKAGSHVHVHNLKTKRW